MTDQVRGAEPPLTLTGQSEEQPDFTQWLAANSSEVLKNAYMCCGSDKSIVEDVFQEAVIKLFKAWNNEEQRASIRNSKGYVFRTVQNAFRSYIRVPCRRTMECETELDLDLPTGVEPDYALRAAIAELPENEHLVIVLRDYGRFTYEEVGFELGMSVHAVRRLHHKAKGNLAAMLNDQQEED